jgi:hypothetical protein
MSPNAAESQPQSESDHGGEHWSLVSIAFGAVSGTVIAILIQPLVDLLPAKLFEEFLTKLVETILNLGLPVLFAYIAARIRRLDHFLRLHLARAAFVASVLLALSLWVHAGGPTNRLAIAASALTMVETWFFLLFCGDAVQSGLSQIVGKQAVKYKEQREADARSIAEQSVAEGDPGMAAGLFAVNAAGEFNKTLAQGCLRFVLLAFNLAAIFVVSALDAHELFKLSGAWSLIAAAIIAAATMPIVLMSEKFGEQHAETVPLDEKYVGILPDRDKHDEAP